MKFLFLVFLSFNCFSQIAITATRDINFGTLVQGDAAKKIGTGKNSTDNARFDVVGTSRTIYTIILPTEIYLVHEFDSSKTLRVNNFKSRPAAGPNGKTNGKGKQTIRVGAKLQKIGNNKLPGNYNGFFTVEVIY